jgi:hypothetical protein
MKNCLLCLTRPADKKGSHIIPFFLIKTMVNEEGFNKRGNKEISFKLDRSSTDFYIGRSVSRESIVDAIGRDLTTEDIEENIDHYTEDNFLCSFCENRLAFLESHYSEKSQKAKIHEDHNINEVQSGIALLFWSTILWRCSVTKFNGFKLQSKEERKLRNIINLCLGISIEETTSNLQNNNSLLESFSSILMIENEPELPTAQVCIIHPYHRFPYSLIINKHVLFFYFKNEHFDNKKQVFWGFEKLINKDLLNNTGSVYEKFLNVPQAISEKAKESINLLKASERHKFIDHVVLSLIKRLKNTLPSSIFLSFFPTLVIEIIKTEVRQKLIDKQNEEFKIINGIPKEIWKEVLSEVFQKYLPLPV